MVDMANLGRPLEFNPEKALDAAMDVFWCKGYEATSITNLLEAMGLSKSSLYQSFGSKRQLFERCLTRYAKWLHTNMTEQLDKSSSGYGFIESILNSIVNTAQLPEGNKGCLMVNSVIEFGQRDPIMAASLAGELQLFSELYIDAVERAQEEGDVPLGADPQAIANYLHVAIGGLRTTIKAGADKESVKGTVALILKALN